MKNFFSVTAFMLVAFGIPVLLIYPTVNDNNPDTKGTAMVSSVVEGSDIPEYDRLGYVTDLSGVLGDTKPLVEKLKAYDESNRGQMAVLTVESTGGLSIEEYSIRVAEKWKVGDTNLDDGIIIVIATKDRKVRIEVGRGASVTDAQAGDVLQSAMIPKLKTGDWSGAVNAGVDAVINLTSK